MRLDHSTGGNRVGASPVPAWRTDPERQGPLLRLTWGGLANSTAQWRTCWTYLHRGKLYLLPSRDAAESEAICQNAWLGRRAAQLAPEAAGGIQHCVAIVKQGTDVSKAAQEGSSLVLRFDDATEVRSMGNTWGSVFFPNAGH